MVPSPEQVRKYKISSGDPLPCARFCEKGVGVYVDVHDEAYLTPFTTLTGVPCAMADIFCHKVNDVLAGAGVAQAMCA